MQFSTPRLKKQHLGSPKCRRYIDNQKFSSSTFIQLFHQIEITLHNERNFTERIAGQVAILDTTLYVSLDVGCIREMQWLAERMPYSLIPIHIAKSDVSGVQYESIGIDETGQ